MDNFVIVESSRIDDFHGTLAVPGDKSVSHRVLIAASQAVGLSKIFGICEGDDVCRTKYALQKMGVEIIDSEGSCAVYGVGFGGLIKPSDIIDLGNSGTSAALITGLISSYNFDTFITGDDSLRSRSAHEFQYPLSLMGANFTSPKMPYVVFGSDMTVPITYEALIPSAKIKSAILFAGLNTLGTSTIIEHAHTRVHTEKILEVFGASICSFWDESGKRVIQLDGCKEFNGANITIPGDPSAAAFFVAAAVLSSSGCVRVCDVLMSDERSGFYNVLKQMGANIIFSNYRTLNGEVIVDIEASSSVLVGVNVPSSMVTSMIDEYPIISVVAAFCDGVTTLNGLHRLRVKESDRLNLICSGLSKCCVRIDLIKDDSVVIHGCGQGSVEGGCSIASANDHRIAMSFAVMGGFTKKPVQITEAEAVCASFPSFVSEFNRLGGKLVSVKTD